MKEQNKISEKELNKVETSNLLDAEFKTLVVSTFNEWKERIRYLIENFNNERGNIQMEIENMKRTSQK